MSPGVPRCPQVSLPLTWHVHHPAVAVLHDVAGLTVNPAGRDAVHREKGQAQLRGAALAPWRGQVCQLGTGQDRGSAGDRDRQGVSWGQGQDRTGVSWGQGQGFSWGQGHWLGTGTGGQLETETGTSAGDRDIGWG